MGAFTTVGGVGGNSRPGQGGLPLHSTPTCLDGWVTNNFFSQGACNNCGCLLS